MLLWFIAFVAGAPLVRAVRVRAWRFAWRPAVVVLVAVGGWLLAPGWAGYVALVAWVALLVIPNLPSMFFTRAIRKGQHRRAAWWARFLGRWDSDDRTLAAAERLEALADLNEGDLAAGKARLATLSGDYDSEMLLLRLDGDWEGILARSLPRLISGEVPDSELLATASFAVRALGELGLIDETFPGIYRTARDLAPGDPTVRLFLAAFAGRPDLVRLLSLTSRQALPDGVVDYWHAAARQARGEDPASLRVLALGGPPLLKIAASQRLKRPLPPPPLLLAPLVAELEEELQDAARYGSITRPPAGRHPVTWAAVSLILAAHLALDVASVSLEERFGAFGLITPASAVPGEWWRIGTAALIHAGWLHAGFNAWALWLFGRYTERLVGSLKLAVGLMSILVLSKATILGWDSLWAGEVRGYVGASDGVMGLLGMAMALLLVGWRRGSRVARQQIIGMGVVVLAQTAFDLTHPEISFKAHSLGLLYGFAYGWLIAVFLPDQKSGGGSPAVDS